MTVPSLKAVSAAPSTSATVVDGAAGPTPTSTPVVVVGDNPAYRDESYLFRERRMQICLAAGLAALGIGLPLISARFAVK